MLLLLAYIQYMNNCWGRFRISKTSRSTMAILKSNLGESQFKNECPNFRPNPQLQFQSSTAPSFHNPYPQCSSENLRIRERETMDARMFLSSFNIPKVRPTFEFKIPHLASNSVMVISFSDLELGVLPLCS